MILHADRSCAEICLTGMTETLLLKRILQLPYRGHPGPCGILVKYPNLRKESLSYSASLDIIDYDSGFRIDNH